MTNYKVVHKPWGKEEWLELNDAYCYKRIYINAGYKTSYQYHKFKKETNYIIEGTAEVWLENDEGIVEKKIMNAGEFFNVTPPKKHRVIAITRCFLGGVTLKKSPAFMIFFSISPLSFSNHTSAVPSII